MEEISSSTPLTYEMDPPQKSIPIDKAEPSCHDVDESEPLTGSHTAQAHSSKKHCGIAVGGAASTSSASCSRPSVSSVSSSLHPQYSAVQGTSSSARKYSGGSMLDGGGCGGGEVEKKKNYDAVKVDDKHGLLHYAIPVMPLPLAALLCVFNIVAPGLGE